MAQDEDLLTESFSARRKCFTVFQRITLVSNIIFALFALLLIVLGGVAVKRLNEYSTYTKITIPAGLIVLGVILLFIIALGVAGSFKKSTKLLAAYFVLLFIFIICEFGVGGGSYAMQDKIPGQLQNAWANLNEIDKANQQKDWNCCGWTSPSDSPGTLNCPNITSNASMTTSAPVVPSTTGDSTTGEMVTGSAERDIEIEYFSNRRATPTNWTMIDTKDGCEPILVKYFQDELYAVGTVGIVFATLQLVALISSIVVFAFIKIEQRRSQDERF